MRSAGERALSRSQGGERETEKLTGLRDRTVRCIIVEGHQEALLHVDGSDAHDGGDEEEEVGEQLHGGGGL